MSVLVIRRGPNGSKIYLGPSIRSSQTACRSQWLVMALNLNDHRGQKNAIQVACTFLVSPKPASFIVGHLLMKH